MALWKSVADPRKRVLVAVDSSEQAEKAFYFYLLNLRHSSDHLTLLHVQELSNISERLMRGEDAPYENWTQIWAKETAKRQEIKNKYEKVLSDNNIIGTVEVKHSLNPGQEIIEMAKEQAMSLIIVGTRGLGRIRRTVLGSVSDFVLHHAHCHVFVYK